MRRSHSSVRSVLAWAAVAVASIGWASGCDRRDQGSLLITTFVENRDGFQSARDAMLSASGPSETISISSSSFGRGVTLRGREALTGARAAEEISRRSLERIVPFLDGIGAMSASAYPQEVCPFGVDLTTGGVFGPGAGWLWCEAPVTRLEGVDVLKELPGEPGWYAFQSG